MYLDYIINQIHKIFNECRKQTFSYNKEWREYKHQYNSLKKIVGQYCQFSSFISKSLIFINIWLNRLLSG
jgi:flagellar capping protein FliD